VSDQLAPDRKNTLIRTIAVNLGKMHTNTTCVACDVDCGDVFVLPPDSSSEIRHGSRERENLLSVEFACTKALHTHYNPSLVSNNTSLVQWDIADTSVHIH
jgi:hypothetical protein